MTQETVHFDDAPTARPAKPRRRRSWFVRFLRATLITLLIMIALVAIARPFMPKAIRWYVNRTLDRSELYQGQIGDVDVALLRGAYSIKDVRINKITGAVPVPLFAAERVEFAMQWDALLNGKLVGVVRMTEPELNFVDGQADAE